MKALTIATAICAGMLLLAACEKKGPMERAGEKLDEAGRTIKNGGEKTPGDKLNDAAHDVGKSVDKAADDLKK